MLQQQHHVLCDGGLGNRFNALVFALLLRERFGGNWKISWPINNWCGARFDELFVCDLPVDGLSIEHYKQNERKHLLLMHENQLGFDPARMTINRTLAGYEDYARFFAAGQSIVYYNNLLPPFVSEEELGRAMQQLRPNAEAARRALDFCRERGVDTSVVGLHIRKTDFGNRVDDDSLYAQVKASPRRHFVCSDSAEVNTRFATLPNCFIFEKTAFPEKRVDSLHWQQSITDDSGRNQPFNITRSGVSVVEGFIDLLILSRTEIFVTSSSTFLQTARLFARYDFLRNHDTMTTLKASRIAAPAAEPPVTPNDLFNLIDLIRPWQMRNQQKVRIGSEADGGYVMPATSKRSNLALSIGVGAEVSFDEELGRQGATVHQFDHTIEKSPSTHPLCKFNRLGWGEKDSHPLVSLKTMINMADWSNVRHPILKFDIEGSEWSCLTSADSSDIARFEVLTGEFHGFDHLPERKFFDTAWVVFKKLNKTHRVVHLHANNAGGMVMLSGVPFPRLLELTWARIDAFTFYGHSNEPIPGPLDRPNLPQLPDLHLRAF
jgi:hypothetical protein